MNILVTGCAGFIGSHAVEEFLSAGHSVTGIDCLTYAGNEKNMSSFIDDIKFYDCDICETERVKKIVEERKIRWIINFAAETHVDNSISSCSEFIHSNVEGVASLLDVCKITGSKLFHISTDEVYGSIKQGSFSEDDKLNPQNPYAATKASAEFLVKSYANTHNIEYLMVRPSNNFGPRQNSEKFIPTILNSLTSGSKVPIYGDGNNVRDWLYVKDNVAAILFILENSNENEIYNISFSHEKSNKNIVFKLCEVLEKDFESNITYVDDRKGHDFRYSIQSKKLIDLGFLNNHAFDTFDVNLNKTLGHYMGQL